LWIGRIVDLLRRVDQVLQAEVRMLGERVAKLEAREDLLVAEAKAAAAAAATQVSIASVSDIARRIGRLEERSERGRLEARDQPKPTDQ
jgi:hypothetical protein